MSIGVANPSPSAPCVAHDDRRGDADHGAGQVEQRTARRTGRDSGIGLDHVEQVAARRRRSSVRPSALSTPTDTDGPPVRPTRRADGDAALDPCAAWWPSRAWRWGRARHRSSRRRCRCRGRRRAGVPACWRPSLVTTTISLAPCDDMVVGEHVAVVAEEHAGSPVARPLSSVLVDQLDDGRTDVFDGVGHEVGPPP